MCLHPLSPLAIKGRGNGLHNIKFMYAVELNISVRVPFCCEKNMNFSNLSEVQFSIFCR